MPIFWLNDEARKIEPFPADTAQSLSGALLGSSLRPTLAFQIDLISDLAHERWVMSNRLTFDLRFGPGCSNSEADTIIT